MTRLAFVLVTATLLLASLSWWWEPQPPGPEPVAAAGPGPGSPPEAVEHAAAADRGDPAAPPAAESPPPAQSAAVPPSAAEPPPTGSPPETRARAVAAGATPTLEEGALEELTPPEAFPGEEAGEAADARPGDAWTLASVPDERPAETPARAQPAPVDIERSGQLVRRMLSLYEAMGE